MTWNPIDEPIDYVILGGHQTPGIASIADAANVYKWDVRRGYGFSGATSVYKGRDLSHLKLLIRLLTAQHWADWDSFREILKPPQPSHNTLTTTAFLGRLRPRALEIEHPFTAMLGIRAVTIEHLKQPEQVGDGEWLIEVGLLEYRRPQFVASRPDGAQQQPTDPADQTIEALRGIVENGGEGDVAQALAPLGGV